MSRCLTLVQGLLLLHRPSQRLFARKSSLEVSSRQTGDVDMAADIVLRAVSRRGSRIEPNVRQNDAGDTSSISSCLTASFAPPISDFSRLPSSTGSAPTPQAGRNLLKRRATTRDRSPRHPPLCPSRPSKEHESVRRVRWSREYRQSAERSQCRSASQVRIRVFASASRYGGSN